jgi:hypothetical protein
MSNKEHQPPFKITAEDGEIIADNYPSYGYACATASNWAIAAKANGSPLTTLLVKDSTDKTLRRVTTNYPAD